jgi:hypothetical protein
MHWKNELRLRVRDRPMRFGLLDADVDLDVLLRIIWRWESAKDPYPGDLEETK